MKRARMLTVQERLAAQRARYNRVVRRDAMISKRQPTRCICGGYAQWHTRVADLEGSLLLANQKIGRLQKELVVVEEEREAACASGRDLLKQLEYANNVFYS